MAQDKDQKTLNVPPLRFTGFTGDWKKTTLGEIGKTFNGLTGKNSNDFGQGSPYITYKSIFDNSKVDISRVEYVTITDNERIKSAQNVVRLGDIFFTTSSETPTEVGMTSVLLDGIEDCYLNSFCFGYRLSNKEETLPEYFRFYLRASVIRNKLSILAQGSTRFNISKNEVMRMGINLPNSSEQEKIAALLSCIDERITTQNKIIEDLKKLKSAIIDRLYSEVKGETCTYSELFTVVTERNSKRTYNKVIAASQEYGMVERESLNLKVQFDEELINTYKIINSGDYVIHLRSFQGGFAFSKLQGICSPAYIILRPNDRVEFSYFENYFTSSKFINSLRLVTYGIRDGRSINVEEWLSMKVTLPSKEEQKRIIRTIQSIQDKVSNEIRILTSLHSQRLFLLRELFI